MSIVNCAKLLCCSIVLQLVLMPTETLSKKKLTAVQRTNIMEGSTHAQIVVGILDNLNNEKLRNRVPTFDNNLSNIRNNLDEIYYAVHSANKSNIVQIKAILRQKLQLKCKFDTKADVPRWISSLMGNAFHYFPSSDRDTRYVWLKKLVPMPPESMFITQGRVRVNKDNVIIMKVNESDTGLYTCVQISHSGFNYQHYQLKVLPFGNSWFSFQNPICYFKWMLVGSFTFFIVQAYYQFYRFDQIKNMTAYETMVVNSELQKSKMF